ARISDSPKAASIGEFLKIRTSFADRLGDPGQRLAGGTVKDVVRRPITKAWNEAKKLRRLSALRAGIRGALAFDHARRVLDLNPIGAPARPVRSIAALRDDALGAERASVAKDRPPVALEVLENPDARAHLRKSRVSVARRPPARRQPAATAGRS